MGSFNIHNSKIDQLSDSGNNYKQVSESGNNSVSQGGNIVNTEGENNRVQVDRPKESPLSAVWKTLKGAWKWVLAYFKGTPS